MAPFFDLSGKHALVTGAVGPLGRALAVALAEAGANVSVTTVEASMAEEVQANSILNECWAAGASAGQAKTLDLTDPDAVEQTVAALEAEVAPIDILVNAAHGATVKPLLDASLDEWRAELDRNATSVFVVTQAVGRRMQPRGKGRVITLVSELHDRGVPNAAIFAASQGAVYAFSRSLALEWGHGETLVADRVTVNAIGLGFIDEVPGVHADPELRAALERYIPLRRLGSPADLQGVLVYLASDESNYVNGERIVVDGAIAVHA